MTIWYKACADDLVFIVKSMHLGQLMEHMNKIAGQFNLKINPKKSNVMAIGKHNHFDRKLNKIHLKGI